MSEIYGQCSKCGGHLTNGHKCFTLENDDLRQKESERVMREEIEKSEWISVKDRLPEKKDDYLCYCEDGDFKWCSIVSYYPDGDGWFYKFSNGRIIKWKEIIMPKESNR
jgi:hypothetical protein